MLSAIAKFLFPSTNMAPKSSTRKTPKRPLTLHIGSLNKSNFIVVSDDPTSSSAAQGSAIVYIFIVDSGYRGHFQPTVDKETQTLIFPADSEIFSDKPMTWILSLPLHTIGLVDSRHRCAIFRAAVYAIGLGAGRHQMFLRNLEASEINNMKDKVAEELDLGKIDLDDDGDKLVMQTLDEDQIQMLIRGVQGVDMEGDEEMKDM